MKLHKRKDFIKLPSNTIYSRVHDDSGNLMDGLFCKCSDGDDTNDWIEQDLISECGFPANIDDGFLAVLHQEEQRDSFNDFTTDLDCAGRDGCYDDNDLFVVWSKSDVKKLYNFLGECLK